MYSAPPSNQKYLVRSVFLSNYHIYGTVIGMTCFVVRCLICFRLNNYCPNDSLGQLSNYDFPQKSFSQFNHLLSEEFSRKQLLFGFVIVSEHRACFTFCNRLRLYKWFHNQLFLYKSIILVWRYILYSG
jgi:hypothetical protein